MAPASRERARAVTEMAPAADDEDARLFQVWRGSLRHTLADRVTAYVKAYTSLGERRDAGAGRQWQTRQSQ